jgi:RNA polymerase sigma-70 factor (ECF subfamily)
MTKALGSGVTDDLARVSDEDLLTRYRDRGRAEDFEELVHRYENELYRYLARYLGDPTLAQDVFQNTFLQVHLKRGLYEDGRPVRPWLYSIATHQAVDALRKAGRHPTVSLDQRAAPGEAESGGLIDLLVSAGEGPLAELQGEERREWVRRSVAKLPETLRQTLVLAYHQDLKYREIAEILKIPVGTVKSRLHAALAKLQQMARADQPDHDGNG